MLSAPPRQIRRAAAAASPPSKHVCFRVGSWRFALAVDEILGLYTGLPLIPSTDLRCSGLVQLPQGRVPVIDLRAPAHQSHILPALALVENHGQSVALAFDFADEVLPVQARGWIAHNLEACPLPARGRTITRHGDVFWLNVHDLMSRMSARSMEN